MLTYIQNVLPRLQAYSKKLDKTENFVDKKWLLIDEASNGHSYEFLRDKRLIMSLVINGVDQETRIGSWELLPSERLLIHRPEPLLLEQAFLGDGLIIFKESGTSKKPFSLYDPKIIQDGNVEAYLNKFLEIKDAGKIRSSTEYDTDGRKVSRNPDGSLFSGEIVDPSDKTHHIVYRDGIETDFYHLRPFPTNRGTVTIHINKRHYSLYPIEGDMVLLDDGLKAPDGLYKFTENDYELISMEVKNGKAQKVEEESTFKKIAAAFGFILIFFLIIGLAIVIFTNNK